MPNKMFWSDYFEDAYRDAVNKRREVLDRGLLFLAHLLREELPTATAITASASVLTTVHDDDSTLWRFNDGTKDRLSPEHRRVIRNVLLDMRSFGLGTTQLRELGWTPVTGQPDTYRIALPADPDSEHATAAARS